MKILTALERAAIWHEALVSEDMANSVVHLPTEEVWKYRQFNPGWGQAGIGDEGWMKSRLKRSVSRTGIQEPFTVTTDGEHAMLEDGHHRLAIARELGISHVPVNVQQVGMTQNSPFGQIVNLVGPGLRAHLKGGST